MSWKTTTYDDKVQGWKRAGEYVGVAINTMRRIVKLHAIPFTRTPGRWPNKGVYHFFLKTDLDHLKKVYVPNER